MGWRSHSEHCKLYLIPRIRVGMKRSVGEAMNLRFEMEKWGEGEVYVHFLMVFNEFVLVYARAYHKGANQYT